MHIFVIDQNYVPMKKTLTLLHSNDLHGDFLADKVDDKLTGGVSMLSGYISITRKEEKNVLYAISGDMFKGSLIDQEYRGISTIEIMNLLAPDVVTLGNHEVVQFPQDYRDRRDEDNVHRHPDRGCAGIYS